MSDIEKLHHLLKNFTIPSELAETAEKDAWKQHNNNHLNTERLGEEARDSIKDRLFRTVRNTRVITLDIDLSLMTEDNGKPLGLKYRKSDLTEKDVEKLIAAADTGIRKQATLERDISIKIARLGQLPKATLQLTNEDIATRKETLTKLDTEGEKVQKGLKDYTDLRDYKKRLKALENQMENEPELSPEDARHKAKKEITSQIRKLQKSLNNPTDEEITRAIAVLEKKLGGLNRERTELNQNLKALQNEPKKTANLLDLGLEKKLEGEIAALQKSHAKIGSTILKVQDILDPEKIDDFVAAFSEERFASAEEDMRDYASVTAGNNTVVRAVVYKNDAEIAVDAPNVTLTLSENLVLSAHRANSKNPLSFSEEQVDVTKTIKKMVEEAPNESRLAHLSFKQPSQDASVFLRNSNTNPTIIYFTLAKGTRVDLQDIKPLPDGRTHSMEVMSGGTFLLSEGGWGKAFEMKVKKTSPEKPLVISLPRETKIKSDTIKLVKARDGSLRMQIGLQGDITIPLDKKNPMDVFIELRDDNDTARAEPRRIQLVKSGQPTAETSADLVELVINEQKSYEANLREETPGKGTSGRNTRLNDYASERIDDLFLPNPFSSSRRPPTSPARGSRK